METVRSNKADLWKL